ncbi:zygote arrest protein 1 [Astyanax mexicanus]|uniref:Zygote arrest 1 n=1 Tax=Astyanax mexicanus TaxID=7994 RepID=A0A8B9KRG1_ASTMX|nr:zygote arrest protein 1 [Astyanax mexicanus]
MASYGDESLDSYLYTSYNPYSYRCPRPKGWRHKSYLAAYGDSDSYLDTYHRAQLKSILSQINPNLTPRLRKANTRDVAVQVNPRAHVSIQCSLGPRTLLQVRRRDSPRARRIDGQTPGSPGSSSSGGGSPGGVRFPRTQAVYSPIASRGLASFLQEEEEEEEERRGAKEEEEEKPQQQENKERRSSKQAEDELSPDKSMEGSEQTGVVDGSKSEAEKSGQEESKIKGRVRFQFLEQKYGYYHCRDCNLRWESAYVWCVQGTNKVYFKQFCRTCQKSFNPYRVEDITCQSCKKARCTCPGTARHVDPKRPHRQDLCGRCKGKRLSCDSTFSFKYII